MAGARDNRITGNDIEGAGEIGFYLAGGCSNAVRFNRMVGNGTDGIDGIHFGGDTGANLYVGDLGVVDADWGELDCDGDGVIDPNITRQWPVVPTP